MSMEPRCEQIKLELLRWLSMRKRQGKGDEGSTSREEVRIPLGEGKEGGLEEGERSEVIEDRGIEEDARGKEGEEENVRISLEE